MKQPQQTLKFYISLLSISIGYILLYSLVNLYFAKQIAYGFIITDWRNYWLPFLLAIIPFFIYCVVKFRHIEFALNKMVLVSLMSAVCVAPAAVLAQFYLETATEQITHLENINQVFQMPESQCYTVEKFFADRTHAGAYSTEIASGRTSYDYKVFIAVPILEKEADTSVSFCKTWLLKSYYRNFGGISGADYRERENAFLSKSLADFKKNEIKGFQYLGRAEFNDEYNNFIQAAQNSSKYIPGQEIYLFESFDEPFAERNGNKLYYFILAFISCELFLVLIARYMATLTE